MDSNCQKVDPFGQTYGKAGTMEEIVMKYTGVIANKYASKQMLSSEQLQATRMIAIKRELITAHSNR